MSDHVLKASIRQTLAYIDAYDADFLRAIEASFKEALQNCEDEDVNSTAKEQATPAPPPEPQPTPQPMHTIKPAKTPNAAAPVTIELLELPTWHYRMPLIATLSITALLFILAR